MIEKNFKGLVGVSGFSSKASKVDAATPTMGAAGSDTEPVIPEVPLAELCPDINLKQQHSLYGLVFRSIGAESLSFVELVMKSCFTALRLMLPIPSPASNAPAGTSTDPLMVYFKQTIEVVWELRRFTILNLSTKLMDFTSFSTVLAKVTWDLKKFPENHSPYIDTIIGSCKSVQERIVVMLKIGFRTITHLFMRTN